MKKHGKAKPKSSKGTQVGSRRLRSPAEAGLAIGPIRLKRIGKGSAARSGKPKSGRAPKARRSSKQPKSSVRRVSVSKRALKRARRSKVRRPQPIRKQKPASAVAGGFQRAADEVPTLEQVTITCANCGRPFKVMKLKGLSLEGTICQRCSLGEMELPESFG